MENENKTAKMCVHIKYKSRKKITTTKTKISAIIPSY